MKLWSKIIWMFFLLGNIALAQSVKKVSAQEEISLESYDLITAQELCGLRARQKAVFKAFQKDITTAESLNQNTDGGSSYQSISEAFPKGVWLEDVKEQVNQNVTINDVPHVKCKVVGTVKRIDDSLLRLYGAALNCPKKSCRTDKIESESSVYLYFKPPCHGYIYVFAVDKDESFAILPYEKMINYLRDGYRVDGGKEYIFFEPSTPESTVAVWNANNIAGELAPLISKVELFGIAKCELNILDVIFSKSPIIPPTLGHSLYKEDYDVYAVQSSGYTINPSIPRKAYLAWKAGVLKKGGVSLSIPVLVVNN